MADPNPPLWEVMRLVAITHARADERMGYAAELRAIAQRLEAKRSELLKAGHTMSCDEAIRWIGHEADRAEAGE